METATRIETSAPARSTSSTPEAELLQVVTFQVGQETFGLDILKVHEIIRFQPLTRMPNLPDYMEGVLNLRGKIIPVVNMRQVMGLDRQETNSTTKIVVASVKDEVLGFVVDSVSEVLRIGSDNVEPSPRVRQAKQNYISGVGKVDDRLLLLLDLDQLLGEKETTNILAAKTPDEADQNH